MSMRPSVCPGTWPLTPKLQRVETCIRQAGGRAVLVGGAVRDMLLGRASKDLDIEVFGLSAAQLVQALSCLGKVVAMGRIFAVWQVRGMGIDFSLQRASTFGLAAQHRDLTLNSMGVDLHSATLLDPLGGRRDLDLGLLRACDPRFFGSDTVRVLRVAQMLARFSMQTDPELDALCRNLSFDSVAPERLYAEWVKLLMLAPNPAIGLDWLVQAQLLHVLPRLPQTRRVGHLKELWRRTCRIVDRAAGRRDGGEDDLALMWAALLQNPDKSKGPHNPGASQQSAADIDAEAARRAQTWLLELKAPHALIRRVAALVRYASTPALLQASPAPDQAYRALRRQLHQAGITPGLLERLACACNLEHQDATSLEGPEDPEGLNSAVDLFAARMHALGLAAHTVPDVVLGRHLIAAGLAPGPRFRLVLDACRLHQDATGLKDPGYILRAVLSAKGHAP